MKALRFRLAGVPVRIDPTFFVIMALLGWSGGRPGWLIVEWVVVAGLSVLVHEMGHAVAFRAFGAAPQVTLHGMGGVTVGTAQPPRRSIVVSLAGPLTGFALGGAALAARGWVATDASLLRVILHDLVFANIAWGVFNLLPILPMDGGNVVASGLELLAGERARRGAHVFSAVAAAALGLAALAAGLLLVAFLSLFFVLLNVQAAKALADQPSSARLNDARTALLRDEPATAAAILGGLIEASPSRRARATVDELSAWASLAAGDLPSAQAAAERLGTGARRELLDGMVALAAGTSTAPLGPCLAEHPDPAAVAVGARLLLRAGRVDEAVDALAESGLFDRVRAPALAYEAARGLARAGADGPALAWLERAITQGFRDVAALEGDPDTQRLRSTEEFRRLRALIAAPTDR